jgi:lipopolysaccharide transport system permease protein
MGQLNNFFLTAAFFLTPICYPVNSLSPGMQVLLQKNPIYKLVAQYRFIFVDWMRPNWSIWAQSLVIGIVVFYAGYALFRKLRPNFVDVL